MPTQSKKSRFFSITVFASYTTPLLSESSFVIFQELMLNRSQFIVYLSPSILTLFVLTNCSADWIWIIVSNLLVLDICPWRICTNYGGFDNYSLRIRLFCKTNESFYSFLRHQFNGRYNWLKNRSKFVFGSV